MIRPAFIYSPEFIEIDTKKGGGYHKKKDTYYYWFKSCRVYLVNGLPLGNMDNGAG